MEKAIYIESIDEVGRLGPGFSRIYYGHEFCERLAPSVQDIDAIADVARERRLSLSFVTPFMTDAGIEAWKPGLKRLHERMPEAEVVINDWGLLRLLRRESGFRQFALGRLLTKQKRGPRILLVQERLPQEAVRHFKQTNADTAALSEFLLGLGIARIELDNLLQGIARERVALKASLHVPFAYVTCSRYCAASVAEHPEIPLRSISECGKECRLHMFRLRHKDMPADLYMKGNAQFIKNETIPDDLAALNIDRIVFQPRLFV